MSGQIKRVGSVWELRLELPHGGIVVRSPDLTAVKGMALEQLLRRGLPPEEALRLLEEAGSA